MTFCDIQVRKPPVKQAEWSVELWCNLLNCLFKSREPRTLCVLSFVGLCGCATLSAFNLICHKGWVISQAAESLSGSQCILFLLKLMSSQAAHSCWGSLALCAVYLEMSSSENGVLWMALSVCVLVLLEIILFVGNVCATVELHLFVSLDVSGYLPVILIGKLCNTEITAGLRNCTDNWSDW